MAIDISAIAELSDREPDFYISRVPGRYFSDTGTIIKIDMWAHSIQEWYNRLYEEIVRNAPTTNTIIAGADIGIILEITSWCKPDVQATPVLSFDQSAYWNRSWQVCKHALYISNLIAEDRFIVAQIEADTVHDLFVGKLL